MTLGFSSVGRTIRVLGIGVTISIVTLVGCGGGDSEIDGLQTSSGSNELPIINEIALRPVRPAPGREVQVNARVSDPDGDPTTVEYRWQTSGGRLLGSGRTFDTTGLSPGARLQVIATPSDGKATGLPVTHRFRLSEPATALGLVVIDVSDGTKAGVTLGSLIDVDNDDSGRADIEIEWQVNGEAVGSTDELETSGFQPGDVVVLRARLPDNGRAGRFVASPPVVLSRGGVPEILSKPLSGIEAGVFRYQIRARSDESQAELSYALLSGPEGMSVDEKSGLVSWRPTELQRGRFEVEVSATDQWGNGVAQSFVIVADAPEAAPASPR